MAKNKLSEAEGIKAIVYLQSAVGIVETEEKARAGWRAMSQTDRESTMEAYQALLRVSR